MAIELCSPFCHVLDTLGGLLVCMNSLYGLVLAYRSTLPRVCNHYSSSVDGVVPE